MDIITLMILGEIEPTIMVGDYSYTLRKGSHAKDCKNLSVMILKLLLSKSKLEARSGVSYQSIGMRMLALGYSHPSLSRHRKGPGNNVEIERDKENVEIRRDFSYITIM